MAYSIKKQVVGLSIATAIVALSAFIDVQAGGLSVQTSATYDLVVLEQVLGTDSPGTPPRPRR
jgi:hypothetical protein